MVGRGGAEAVMGFHGLSPGVVTFSSGVFILNCAWLWSVCLVSQHGGSLSGSLPGHCHPAVTKDNRPGRGKACPLVEAAQNNLTLNEFVQKRLNVLSDFRKTFWHAVGVAG